jgi:lathosterol oxidase
VQTLNLVVIITIVQILRYLIIAGLTYLVIFKWWRNRFEKYSIQNLSIKKEQIIHELKHSLITSIIFGFIFMVLVHPLLNHYSKIYLEFKNYPIWWNILTIPFLIIINDTYFYWMHRFIHWKKIYRFTHQTHHFSTNPTPLAAYSFHPIEAVLEAIWIFPVIFLIPIQKYLLITYVTISFINNVRGHASINLVPEERRKNLILKWINTSTHHNHHHKYFNYNFGLYFLFWDKLCGTEKKYE